MRAILFLAALLLASPIARADTDGKLRGRWAAPDCAAPREGVMITRDFHLRSTEDETVFSPVSSAKRGDYWALTLAGIPHPAARTEDSILKIGNLESPPASWPRAWDDLQLDGRNEYTGCPDAPAVIPVPLVRVMGFIDALKDACAADGCGKFLFSVADSNKDKKISRAEMKKMGAMLFVFAPLAEGRPVPTSALEAAYKTGMDEGAKAADTLISLRDADKSGDLDAGELQGFLPLLNSPALIAALHTSDKIIPLSR